MIWEKNRQEGINKQAAISWHQKPKLNKEQVGMLQTEYHSLANNICITPYNKVNTNFNIRIKKISLEPNSKTLELRIQLPKNILARQDSLCIAPTIKSTPISRQNSQYISLNIKHYITLEKENA